MQQEPKVELKPLIAIDISGSVGQCDNYWEVVQKIYEANINKNTVYLVWDSEAKFVDEAEVQKYIEQKNGYGGTSPQSFVSLFAKTKMDMK